MNSGMITRPKTPALSALSRIPRTLMTTRRSTPAASMARQIEAVASESEVAAPLCRPITEMTASAPWTTEAAACSSRASPRVTDRPSCDVSPLGVRASAATCQPRASACWTTCCPVAPAAPTTAIFTHASVRPAADRTYTSSSDGRKGWLCSAAHPELERDAALLHRRDRLDAGPGRAGSRPDELPRRGAHVALHRYRRRTSDGRADRGAAVVRAAARPQ